MTFRHMARETFIPGTEAPPMSVDQIEHIIKPIRLLVAEDTEPLNVQVALDVITDYFNASYEIITKEEFARLPNSKTSEALWDAAKKTIFIPEDVFLDSPPTRSRFTICHELTHMILNHKTPSFFSGRNILTKRTDIPIYCDPEWQADKGASFLLMPTQGILELKTFSPSAIMRQYLTSYKAALIQLELLVKRKVLSHYQLVEDLSWNPTQVFGSR